MAGIYSATTIAKWFVDWANSDDAELSNLKLQKLLYYAQGHYLADNDRPLFRDDIQAWSHGPVVPDVYHAFKGFGAGPISLQDDDPFEWDDVDSATSQFLAKVWNTYGSVAAWKLRNMTHAEAPWMEHFNQGERHVVIPKEEIKAYFQFRAG
ncbi:Panacea domain-containing protein [Mycobacterium colombiense]